MKPATLSKTTMESVKAELAAVRKLDRKKKLRPELVVSWAAKNRASEVAKQLEWDNSVAGEAYRIEQARRIITLITFKEETTQTIWRSFVSIPSDRIHGGGYMPTEDALRVSRREMVDEAVGSITTYRQRYTHLPELTPFFDAIDKLAEKYRAAQAA